MTFGEKLKKLRIEKQLSQEDLANQLGVSRQAISKWEQDIALPDTNNLILIAKIFKVSLDDLVNYNDELINNNNNNKAGIFHGSLYSLFLSSYHWLKV